MKPQGWALSTYMGHANISITLDLYGHLLPGSENEAAELLDAYLASQRAGSRAGAGGGADPALTLGQRGMSGRYCRFAFEGWIGSRYTRT